MATHPHGDRSPDETVTVGAGTAEAEAATRRRRPGGPFARRRARGRRRRRGSVREPGAGARCRNQRAERPHQPPPAAPRASRGSRRQRRRRRLRRVRSSRCWPPPPQAATAPGQVARGATRRITESARNFASSLVVGARVLVAEARDLGGVEPVEEDVRQQVGLVGAARRRQAAQQLDARAAAAALEAPGARDVRRRSRPGRPTGGS